MVDYAKIQARATKAIRKYGTVGALRQIGQASGDQWDPGENVVTEIPVNVVIIDYTERERRDTAIQQSDVRALISAEGYPINVGASYELAISEVSGTSGVRLVEADDLLSTEDGGVVVREENVVDIYNVVTIKPLKPGGRVIMYDAQVRK